jgi:hypothetical protein
MRICYLLFSAATMRQWQSMPGGGGGGLPIAGHRAANCGETPVRPALDGDLWAMRTYACT